LRFEDGDGIDCATAAGLHAAATGSGTLCRSRPDAEIRVEAEAGAQGAAPCTPAREKDNDHHDNDNHGTGARTEPVNAVHVTDGRGVPEAAPPSSIGLRA